MTADLLISDNIRWKIVFACETLASPRKSFFHGVSTTAFLKRCSYYYWRPPVLQETIIAS